MTTKIYCDKCGKVLEEKEHYIRTGISQVYTCASNDYLTMATPDEEEVLKNERKSFKAKWDHLAEKDFCHDCINKIMK